MFDAFIDPPIGVRSDRTVSRFGRRRPWLLGASFFCGLSFAMLLTFAGTAGADQREPDPKPPSLAGNFRLLRGNLPLLVLMATNVGGAPGREAARVPGVHGRVRPRHAVLALASPAEPDLALYARALWLGASNAGLFLFGYSMLVDTYAFDHQVTGLRREGFLASAISFVEKFSLAIGPLIIGALLSARGFDKNLPPAADQSAGARQAMLIGFVWIPVGTRLLAMLLLRWYRLEQCDLRDAGVPANSHRVVDSPGEGIPPGRVG